MFDVLPKNEWIEKYTPFSANSYLFTTENRYIYNLNKYSSKEIINIYMSTLMSNPLCLFQDRMAGLDIMWNLDRAYGYYIYKIEPGIMENPYGLSAYNPDLQNRYFNVFFPNEKNTEILDIFLWRTGLYIFIMLQIIGIYTLVGRKSYNIVFIPIFANIFSLILSMCWQDYRYIYNIFIVSIFLIIDFFTMFVRDK